jgi:hypothetical protein
MCSVALLVPGGGDHGGTGWSLVDSTAASVAPSVSLTAGGWRAGECILRSYRGGVHSAPRPSSASMAGAPDSASGEGSANMTVSIPPVVLIRSHGHRLVVTTNTGEPPQPTDTFYVIAPGRGHLAGPALRQRVLTRCAHIKGSGGHRTGPP